MFRLLIIWYVCSSLQTGNFFYFEQVWIPWYSLNMVQWKIRGTTFPVHRLKSIQCLYLDKDEDDKKDENDKENELKDELVVILYIFVQDLHHHHYHHYPASKKSGLYTCDPAVRSKADETMRDTWSSNYHISPHHHSPPDHCDNLTLWGHIHSQLGALHPPQPSSESPLIVHGPI